MFGGLTIDHCNIATVNMAMTVEERKHSHNFCVLFFFGKSVLDIFF